MSDPQSNTPDEDNSTPDLEEAAEKGPLPSAPTTTAAAAADSETGDSYEEREAEEDNRA